MRINRILLAKLKEPSPAFKRSGKTFDKLFPAPQKREKAWAGQDKDAFFRDKYAHVHAKQMKRKKEEQETALKRNDRTVIRPKPLSPQPRPEFSSKLAERLEKNRNLEFIYGRNAVIATINSRRVSKLLTGFNRIDELDPEIIGLANDHKIPIEFRVPTQYLQIMSSNGVHNKYVVETEKKQPTIANTVMFDGHRLTIDNDDEIPFIPELRNFKQPLGLYIDQVTDTHNMGALLRSALWFGVDFVAFSARNSAPLSPAVVKASSGASEFLQILEVPYPLRLFDSLKASDWNVVATAPNKDTLAKHNISLTEVDPKNLQSMLGTTPTLLVVGSEGDGIRTSLLQRSTHSTTIHTGQQNVNSLNVSVAAAVLLDRITS